MPAWLTLTATKSLFGKVPRWVWTAIAIGMLLMSAKCAHDGSVRKHDAEVIAKQDARWKAAFDKMHEAAMKWRENYEQRADAVSSRIGDDHAKELRRNAATAADLRVRGPGKAAARCGPGNHPEVPTAAGERDAAGAPSDAGVAGVPADAGLALVPWTAIVGWGETCDASRSEVIAWRRWHIEQSKLREAATHK